MRHAKFLHHEAKYGTARLNVIEEKELAKLTTEMDNRASKRLSYIYYTCLDKKNKLVIAIIAKDYGYTVTVCDTKTGPDLIISW